MKTANEKQTANERYKKRRNLLLIILFGINGTNRTGLFVLKSAVTRKFDPTTTFKITREMSRKCPASLLER